MKAAPSDILCWSGRWLKRIGQRNAGPASGADDVCSHWSFFLLFLFFFLKKGEMFFFRTSAPLSDLAVWSRSFFVFFFWENEAARTSRRNLEGEGRTLPVALREDVGCNTWEISYFLSPPVGPFVWFRLWFLGGTEGLVVREREISFFNAPLHFGADLATLGLFCRTPPSSLTISGHDPGSGSFLLFFLSFYERLEHNFTWKCQTRSSRSDVNI